MTNTSVLDDLGVSYYRVHPFRGPVEDLKINVGNYVMVDIDDMWSHRLRNHMGCRLETVTAVAAGMVVAFFDDAGMMHPACGFFVRLGTSPAGWTHHDSREEAEAFLAAAE